MRAAFASLLLLVGLVGSPTGAAPDVCVDSTTVPPAVEAAEGCGQVVKIQFGKDEVVVHVCAKGAAYSRPPDTECREVHVRYAGSGPLFA